MSLPSDPIALVARIRDGDEAAEDAVVRLFQRDVYRLLHARTHDREATRELSNDVLMAVVCALRAGRLQEASRLRAFVKGIVRNVAAVVSPSVPSDPTSRRIRPGAGVVGTS